MSLRRREHFAKLATVTDKPRELTETLNEMDRAERAVRHAPLGLTPEDPLEAMKRLGDLVRELESLWPDSSSGNEVRRARGA